MSYILLDDHSNMMLTQLTGVNEMHLLNELLEDAKKVLSCRLSCRLGETEKLTCKRLSLCNMSPACIK